MPDKFNAFSKAQEEAQELKKTKTEATQTTKPRRKKERKVQMSLMFTPTHKAKLISLADQEGISVSELLAEWIDHH